MDTVLSNAVENNDRKYMKLLDKKFPIIFCNENHVDNQNEVSTSIQTETESIPSNTGKPEQALLVEQNTGQVDTHKMENSKSEELLVVFDDNTTTVSDANSNNHNDDKSHTEVDNKFKDMETGEPSNIEQENNSELTDNIDLILNRDQIEEDIGDENNILQLALSINEDKDAEETKPKFKYEANVSNPVELTKAANNFAETDLKPECKEETISNNKPLNLAIKVPENVNLENKATTSALNKPESSLEISDVTPKSSEESKKIIDENQYHDVTHENDGESMSSSTTSPLNTNTTLLETPTQEPDLPKDKPILDTEEFIVTVQPSSSATEENNTEICDVIKVENDKDSEPCTAEENTNTQEANIVKEETIVSQNSGITNAENIIPDEVSQNIESDNVVDGNEVVIPNDFPDDTSANSLTSISGKLNILDYAQSEWKGTTFKANCMRKGYQKLMQATGCRLMRQIRGDNYCALRATAFQVLSQNVRILKDCSNRDQFLLELPNRLLNVHKCEWIKQWTFADRIPSTLDKRIKVMEKCMSLLVEQLNISNGIDNVEDRQSHFSALFNSGSLAEVKLFEAFKLLMLEKAIELHARNCKGEDVPVFSWLLFARDTSEEPKSFMLNHLNQAGKAGGLEQVEMFLLGQAIEITIRVIRPSSVDQEDFVTFYPDHMVNEWDQVTLIAEDDRHYNIVMK